ncbi:MAG: glycosyltransferase family 39 protein [Patescibacteria group bacterium]
MKIKYWLIVVSVILLGLFFRTYKTPEYLGFWYDQGRDALVIWDLIYNHKFFLIGPTTGIAGIFRGPWYYWLITPLYFFGKGDPVWPAVFLAVSTVVAAILCFFVSKRIAGVQAGIVALIISTLSYSFVGSARWLSNPTPMFLISACIIYFVFRIIDGRKNSYLPLAFLLGLSMQFGSAAEVFYFPAVIGFFLFQKRLWPGFKILICSLILMAVPFGPQIFFDFRHDHILTKNILDFLVTDQSFKLSFLDTLSVRLPFYYYMFGGKIFPSNTILFIPFAIAAALSLFIRRRNLSPHESFLGLLFVAPLIGMLFFHGNQGNVYDYYFTGYYLAFTVLFSVSLVKLFSKKIGLVITVIFLSLFLKQNLKELINYVRAGVGPYITLATEIKAVDWIYKEAGGQPFNTDAYVPPMIPYSYNYLFLWRGTHIHHQLPTVELLPALYTIQEPDPGHQTLLDAWRARQATFSSIEKSYFADSLLVEKRHRHEK